METTSMLVLRHFLVEWSVVFSARKGLYCQDIARLEKYGAGRFPIADY